ncbi:MAG: hypothetical protein IID46_08550 [Planctomycetes bacterium]|nr:hypothetical protein [Planctomycetota bacterium]
MRRCVVLPSVILVCLFLGLSGSFTRAAEKQSGAKTAADFFPASTIAYAELRQPMALMDLILEHPLRQRVEQFDQVRELLESPQYTQFRAIVTLIERQIGMKWKDALATLIEGGVSVGFDPKTEGFAVVIRSKNQEGLEKLRDSFLKLARDEAQRQGNEDPIKTVEYRGITAYSAADAKFATVGPWLVLVNNDELGKAVLDNYLDGNENSLASDDQFQASRKLIEGEPTVWAYFNVAAFRAANADSPLYKKKTDNVLIELLIGGMLGTIQNTPYAVSSLDITKHGIAFKVAAPHDPAWVGEEREYFFGPGGKGAALPLLRPKQTILSLSTYRNFSGMWLRSADIFEDNVDAGFAQASGVLSTFFSGKDFGEDILGSFKPEVQIVAARQQFEESSPIPAVKIPAFAVIFRFKEPEKMRSEFRRTFLSLIGFLNVIGAQNGQPQLDLDFEKTGETRIITSTYVPEADEKNSKRAKINFNFSPSVGFVGDYLIVSSTKQFVRELVELAEKPKLSGEGKENAITTNTQLETDLSVVRDALEDNRKQLVARNMLSEGRDKAEAEKQIGILLEALGLLRNVSLQLSTSSKTIQFELEIKLAK